MYNPKAFRETDTRRLHDLIDAHPFGMLVVPGESDVEIAHVPFLLDRGAGPLGTLRLHVSRANPVWRAAAGGRPVVAVFRGPDAYVSASWYESPSEQVPTWNYAVVHAHGRAAEPMATEELRRLLADLAAAHESAERNPWRMEIVRPGLVAELLEEIVGLSIPVERLDGKFKLSQNRSAEDRARVRRALAARGGPGDSEMVRRMGGWAD